MTTSMTSLLSFSLSLLLLFHGSLAQTGYRGSQGRDPSQGERRFGSQSQCRIERLNAQEPRRRIESEAGVSEYFDEDNEQFECAGVSAVRRTIQPGGLLLPSFSNSPALVYIDQGRGFMGMVIPGCPESFQTFQQAEQRGQEGQSQRVRDQHQRIHHFREGDVIALPAGVAYWCYNDGDSPLVTINVMDTSNNANQLDRNHRQFLLAGRRQRSQQPFGGERESSGRNILSGFDTQMLSEVMGISRELGDKIQGQNDERGEIVQVRGRLDVVRPSRREEGREEYEYEEREGRRMNGLEQAFCSMRIRENINDPTRADVYTPRGGRITSLNSQKLPILSYLSLSAERGVLRRNSFVAPHWNINAHSVMYVTRGRCRCQIVGNQGRSVFDGELRQGQLVIVPQNFAVLKQARDEDFEWVSFKTNDNAMVNYIVGKASTLRGMPEEVLMNSYRISREEARMLKENRGLELGIFTPRSQGRASA